MSSAVRLSVCRLSSSCLSVCNVGAPYSGDWNFRQCFYAMWYLGLSPCIQIHTRVCHAGSVTYRKACFLSVDSMLYDSILWPWPWPDDLDMWTWPRDFETLLHTKMNFQVTAYRKTTGNRKLTRMIKLHSDYFHSKTSLLHSCDPQFMYVRKDVSISTPHIHRVSEKNCANLPFAPCTSVEYLPIISVINP